MFIVCQIGAREHYAVARALHASNMLAGLVTDFWVSPGSSFACFPGTRRLRDRFHADLTGAQVLSANARFLAFEIVQRLANRSGWQTIINRNRLFGPLACRWLTKLDIDPRSPVTIFSYSYAARDLFRFAKSRGWATILGQIDPGPEEERIVAIEQNRYPKLTSSWKPAPDSYWESWRDEIALADRIIVNSEWSRRCLIKEAVPTEKIEIVPLVYSAETDQRSCVESLPGKRFATPNTSATQVLFLGQIILRKGIGRLLDAMRLLKDEPIELILAGPSEIEPAAWADLANVRWIGPVPRSDCARVYQNADCFILPTLSDGYALTQLEALSYGVPVIASKHCGDAVSDGKNGWILDDLEPATLARAIRTARKSSLPDIRPPQFSLNDLASHILKAASPPAC